MILSQQTLHNMALNRRRNLKKTSEREQEAGPSPHTEYKPGELYGWLSPAADSPCMAALDTREHIVKSVNYAVFCTATVVRSC